MVETTSARMATREMIRLTMVKSKVIVIPTNFASEVIRPKVHFFGRKGASQVMVEDVFIQSDPHVLQDVFMLHLCDRLRGIIGSIVT